MPDMMDYYEEVLLLRKKVEKYETLCKDHNFDLDNDYLKSWTKEKKINHVHDWKDDWKKNS